MTEVLLFLAFLVVLGVGLIVLDDSRRKGRARAGQLTEQLHDTWTVLRQVEREARAQLDAGDPNFDYLLRLITDADVLPRKELPR